MGFNAKAFATAFLNSQATSINERLADAKKYKEEQEELARQNIGLYKKRKQQMMMRVRMGKAMKDWGASHAQVLAYANSGAGALQEAYKALMTARTAAGISGDRKLHQTTVDAILGTADAFTDDKTTIENFMAKTSGIYKDLMDTETDDKSDPSIQEGNWMLAAMGYGAKDRAKRTLREKQIFEDMTVQGLNDLARTEDIQQILPGAMSSLKVIPQNITASERNRIVDDFNAWATEHFKSISTEELKELEKKYPNKNTSQIFEDLQLVGSDIFNEERKTVLADYLGNIGDPFTESLVLRSIMMLGDDEQTTTEKEVKVEVDDALEEMPSEIDELDQQSLALNYPEAPIYNYDGPKGGIEELESFMEFVKQNNLEAELKEGQSVVIVDEGKYQVLTEDDINLYKEGIKAWEREQGDITPLKKSLQGLFENEWSPRRAFSDAVTDQTRLISTPAGAFVTINDRKAAQSLLDDLMDNQEQIEEYLNNNPEKIDEFRQDPATFLNKHNLTKEK